jgi:glycogen debranching enzyme
MVNAIKLGARLIEQLPRDARSPETTEGRDGFVHPFDLAGAEETQLVTNCISCLLPLVLDDLPAPHANALIGHLEDESEYATPFPLPSVAMSEPAFEPGVVGERLLWRGPVWINTNWYLVRGLRRHGRDDLAARITEQTLELIDRSGFREYYDPFTGEGYGATDFSWSALALDLVSR